MNYYKPGYSYQGGVLFIGNTNSRGIYELSGGWLSAAFEIIGSMGTFTQSGGSNQVTGYPVSGYPSPVGTLRIAAGGTYDLSAGQLSAPYADIYGTFTQSGGVNSAGTLSLAGSYNLSGTGQLSSGNSYINGSLQQSGGQHTASCVTIGFGGGYALSAGTLSLTGGLIIDNNFMGLNLSNSSALIKGTSSIVDLSKVTGSIDAAPPFLNSPNVAISLDAHSLLIVSAGFEPQSYYTNYSNAGFVHHAGSTLTISSADTIYGIAKIADPVVCQGTLSATSGYSITLSGGLNVSNAGNVNLGSGSLYVNNATSAMTGGSLTAETQYVGSAGTGTFTQSGGTTSLSSLYVGNNANDNGTYLLSGSAKLASSIEYIGMAGTGTFSQSGGTHTVSDALGLGESSGGNGTYNLNGGTLVLKKLYQGSGSATFNFGGGTLRTSGKMTCSLPMTLTGNGGNANVDTNGYAGTLSGILSGVGGLNKRGSGTLTLGAANSYYGDTNVYAGTLTLTAAASINNSSIIDVRSGAAFNVSAKSGGFGLQRSQKLMGAGTVAGSVSAAAGSHIAPGDGIGKLIITGSLTLADGALLDYELGTTANSDQISMSSSALTLNGLDFSDFTFTACSGFGEGEYKLIDALSISGLGTNVTGAIGYYYTGTLSVSSGDLMLTVVPVPEPGTLAMLLAAGVGLACIRRETRRRQAVRSVR